MGGGGRAGLSCSVGVTPQADEHGNMQMPSEQLGPWTGRRRELIGSGGINAFGNPVSAVKDCPFGPPDESLSAPPEHRLRADAVLALLLSPAGSSATHRRTASSAGERLNATGLGSLDIITNRSQVSELAGDGGAVVD